MKPGDRIKLEDYYCGCGTLIQSGIHLTGQAGDTLVPGATLFICSKCQALHRLGRDRKPHPFTEDDEREFRSDPMAWFRIMMVIDEIKKARIKLN